MTAFNAADIEQLSWFARRVREMLPNLRTLSASLQQSSAQATSALVFSADLFPGLACRQRRAAAELSTQQVYTAMLADIEQGLRELEALLQRREYGDYLLARCELLGRQTTALLVVLKQRQSSPHGQPPAPPLATLVRQDKTRMAQRRLQQQLQQQFIERQQLQHLLQRFEQELHWQKGASVTRREELQARLQSYAQRIAQLSQDIAYKQQRLDNIREYLRQTRTPAGRNP
jgi:hypothetical protein